MGDEGQVVTPCGLEEDGSLTGVGLLMEVAIGASWFRRSSLSLVGPQRTPH